MSVAILSEPSRRQGSLLLPWRCSPGSTRRWISLSCSMRELLVSLRLLCDWQVRDRVTVRPQMGVCVLVVLVVCMWCVYMHGESPRHIYRISNKP